MERMNFCHPVTVEWFSMQILVNFEIFKPSRNLEFLKHYEASVHNRKFETSMSKGKKILSLIYLLTVPDISRE